MLTDITKFLLRAALSNAEFVQFLMDNITTAAELLKDRLPDVGDVLVDVIVRTIENAIASAVDAAEVAAAFGQTLSPSFGSSAADSVSDLRAFGCTDEDCDCLKQQLAG